MYHFENDKKAVINLTDVTIYTILDPSNEVHIRGMDEMYIPDVEFIEYSRDINQILMHWIHQGYINVGKEEEAKTDE